MIKVIKMPLKTTEICSSGLNAFDAGKAQANNLITINVYPNPVISNVLNYFVNNIKPGKMVVTIANTNGLIVYKQEFTLLDTSFNKTFNMSSLLNGVYSLQVDNGTEKRSVKFAKQ